MTIPIEEYLRTLTPEHQDTADPLRLVDALTVAHRRLAIDAFRRGLALLFLASVIAALGVVARLTRPEPGVLLALAFSLVPAWMYWGFAANQVPVLYAEYVLALHRMKADDPGSLPEPPRDSAYWGEWAAAREPDSDRGVTNLYVRKFEAFYGQVTKLVSISPTIETGTPRHSEPPRRARSDRSKGGLPVILLTVGLGAGWIAVLHPDAYRDLELPFAANVATPVGFAFVGLYLSVLQEIGSRYLRAALNAGVYIRAVVRLTVVLIVTGLLAHLLPLSTRWLEVLALVIAFLSGMFPVLSRMLARTVWMRRQPSQSLMALEGMSIWYEARLFEEGVEDLESLCRASLIDLVLLRVAPTAHLVDWIDQGILRLHVDASSLDRLRRVGIRTATDLLLVTGDDMKSRANVVGALIGADLNEGGPALDAIRSAVEGEPNFFHVSAWKARTSVAMGPPTESP